MEKFHQTHEKEAFREDQQRQHQITGKNQNELLDSDSDKDLTFNSPDERMRYIECGRQVADIIRHNGQLRTIDEMKPKERNKFYELVDEMDGILAAAEAAKDLTPAKPLGAAAPSSLPEEAQLGATLPPVAEDSEMSARERDDRRNAAWWEQARLKAPKDSERQVQFYWEARNAQEYAETIANFNEKAMEIVVAALGLRRGPDNDGATLQEKTQLGAALPLREALPESPAAVASAEAAVAPGGVAAAPVDLDEEFVEAIRRSFKDDRPVRSDSGFLLMGLTRYPHRGALTYLLQVDDDLAASREKAYVAGYEFQPLGPFGPKFFAPISLEPVRRELEHGGVDMDSTHVIIHEDDVLALKRALKKLLPAYRTELYPMSLGTVSKKVAWKPTLGATLPPVVCCNSLQTRYQ